MKQMEFKKLWAHRISSSLRIKGSEGLGNGFCGSSVFEKKNEERELNILKPKPSCTTVWKP